jgi:uncharacterized protein YjbI with pentapeptide repeats
MGLFHWFSTPKPMPVVIINNVLGEVLLQIPGRWDLIGANLKGLDLAHADLSGMFLDGADMSGANLFGARCVGTSFARCKMLGVELSFSNCTSADFQGSNLDGCLMYRSETTLARFDGAVLSESSDVPGIKLVIA